MIGTVKWFNSTKGFGFLAPELDETPDPNDVFVHITAVKAAGLENLEEGQRISFDIGENRGKPIAENLALL